MPSGDPIIDVYSTNKLTNFPLTIGFNCMIATYIPQSSVISDSYIITLPDLFGLIRKSRRLSWVLRNPSSTLNSKQHDVTSQYSAPLSLAIEQPVTLEPTQSNVRRHSPLEGVPSQVAGSTSCGLKCKLQAGDMSDVFDRYSQLCARNVFPCCSSSSSQFPNSGRKDKSSDWENATCMPRSVGKEIILDFEQSVVRLASNERDLEMVLLKPRHFRDDCYGCLFQQSGSVETQGESSGTGCEPCAIANSGFLLTMADTTGSTHIGPPTSTPSKMVHYNVFQTTLPSEGSPSKRSRSSTLRVRNRRLPKCTSATGQYYSSGHIGEHELENRMRHFGDLDNSNLDPEIVQCLINFLDSHNKLVQLFRTARDRCREIDIPEFKIRLYNGDGARGYELLASNTLGAIVFYSGLIGFHTELKLRRADGSEEERQVMMLAYYAYQLHPRDYTTLFKEGSGMALKLVTKLYFQCLSYGGLAIYKKIYGRYLELTAADRPVIVCRVFEQKIHAFLNFLKSEKIFGTVTGVLYIVEFQKRGLPHCHTLLWVDSANKIQEPKDVDRVISAELPDPQIDPHTYKFVSEMMIHGSCGAINMSATCMQGDKCTKSFPKKFTSKTFFDDKGHVHYQRRDTGVSTIKHQRITFRDGDRIEYVVNLPGRKSMTLTEWFAYNAANEDGRHLTYLDFPSEFVWYDDHKSWWSHQNSRSSVGRLADFPEVQTVHDIFYPTCRAACQALGLLEDDNE
ncbi:DNA helicase [Tanacetum coccineum]